MMAKVLFSHSYFYRLDPKQWKAAQPYPPLGTITAAALLRQQGFEVCLFDSALSHGPGELLPYLQKDKPDYLVMYDDGFNYLTKMCLTNMREAAFKMIQMARQQEVKVVVCSSDSTDHAEEYLKQGADYIIMGEGERTLLELLTDADPAAVSGIAYYNGSKVCRTAPRPVLRDLDSLPMAAWDLVDIENYRSVWLQHHGYFSLNLATTRGCPFKCNWCAKPIYGNRYNSRSPIKVVDEIQYLVERYKPDHFWMCDDIFGLKPGWVTGFKQELHKRNLSISFKIQSRVDLLLQENTISNLVEAGLVEVWVGAESGSQKILDAMDKGIQISQIYQASAILKKHGVRLGFFLQFGYLGETPKDIAQTLKMVRRITPHNIGVSVSYPLPGTGFYQKVNSQMQTKSNWKDSDDLDTLYHSPYPASYYKILHRYVHKLFRRQKAREQLRILFKEVRKVQARELFSALYYEPVYWAYWARLQWANLFTANR